MNKKVFTAVVSGLVLAMATYTAFAVTCTTSITGGIIKGGVDVPPGATCNLTLVIVNGGVTIGAGASLEACSSRINGGVQADGSNAVVLGEVDTDSCPGNTINGGVHIANSSLAELDANAIHGTVTLMNIGFVEVESNAIDGSLRCSGNTDISNDGFPNAVTGQETGQCAGF
jgi:hypothetical protein